MQTSDELTHPSQSDAPDRAPLRLALAEHPGRGRLDGAWWPQSRDLAVELADLVDHFPKPAGRVVRALFSPPDWDPAPRLIPVAGGFVEVASFAGDDTHLVDLGMSGHGVIHVLVVPPAFTAGQGAEALLAGATAGNAHSAGDLLDEVTNQLDVDPHDHWDDDGGSSGQPA